MSEEVKVMCSECKSPLGDTYNCDVCIAFKQTEAMNKINEAMRKMPYHGGVALLEELTDNLLKPGGGHTGRGAVRTVTDFVQRYMVNNGDSFYTPYENSFKTHEEAVKEYNSRWNQNRGSGEDAPKVWTGPGPDDYGPDPRNCGAEECDHANHEPPHPKMFGFIELPYGHICDNCGGSMVAVIQVDEHGEVLKTLLNDCG